MGKDSFHERVKFNVPDNANCIEKIEHQLTYITKFLSPKKDNYISIELDGKKETFTKKSALLTETIGKIATANFCTIDLFLKDFSMLFIDIWFEPRGGNFECVTGEFQDISGCTYFRKILTTENSRKFLHGEDLLRDGIVEAGKDIVWHSDGLWIFVNDDINKHPACKEKFQKILKNYTMKGIWNGHEYDEYDSIMEYWDPENIEFTEGAIIPNFCINTSKMDEIRQFVDLMNEAIDSDPELEFEPCTDFSWGYMFYNQEELAVASLEVENGRLAIKGAIL